MQEWELGTELRRVEFLVMRRCVACGQEERTRTNMVFGVGVGVMVMMIKRQKRNWGVREAG